MLLKFAVLSVSFLLVTFHAMGGILPEIRDSLGITQSQSELLVTIPTITILIFVILSNVLINKIGIKKMVVLGLLLIGIGGIMPAFTAHTFFMVALSRLIFGAGTGLVFTPAVTYINVLFSEQERAKLIGFRSAIELVGQALMTIVMGLLVSFGWHMSFLAKGIAFFIAFLFIMVVPDIPLEKLNTVTKSSEGKMNPLIYLLMLFLTFMALSGSMIAIRFPAMLTHILGDDFNPSLIVAMKPVLGIIAAVYFGKLYQLLGKKLFYIGILCLAGAHLFIGFSNGNVVLLIIGFLLSSFVLGWLVPIVIMLISKITSGKKQRTAMAFMLIATNIIVFLMPFIVNFIEFILNNHELTAPYPLMGFLSLVVLLIVIYTSQNKKFRLKVGIDHE